MFCVLQFEYFNIRGEKQLIDFQSMTETRIADLETSIFDPETCKAIRRSVLDQPSHWEVQKNSIAQVPVKVDSPEYKKILALFDKTMANKYTDIVHLYRIQNKQWHMHYNIHKRFSSKRNTERRLFHGCEEESVQLIINSFFNRSFAGING